MRHTRRSRRMRTVTVAGAVVSALVLATVGMGTGPAGAASPSVSIGEFAPFQTPASFPCEVAVDNAGNLWSDQFTGNSYGEVNPTTGAVSQVPLPNAAGLPGGQNRGPDGDIWFVESGGNALGRLHPATRTITTYAFPWASVSLTVPGLPSVQNGAGVPFDDSWGVDGKIYFTLIGLNAIGSYDVSTGTWAKYDIPTPVSGPIAMERGTGNTIAIAEGTANKIGLFDVYTHQWREFAIPTPASLPGGLTISPDGQYLYFGETLGNKIGRLQPSTGQVKEYDILALRKSLNIGLGNPLPNPGQLRFGSDGKLYFVEGTFTAGDTIGQLDVSTSALQEFHTPTPLSSPCDLNNTVPGKIYFGEFTGNRIGYLNIPNTVDVSSTYPLYG